MPTVMIPAAALLLVLQLMMRSVDGAGPPAASCPDKCGDVSVPYPFGIGDGCSIPGFALTCDATRRPPRLVLGNGTLQVVDISLADSTVRVMDLAGAVDITPYTEFAKGGNGTWTGASADRGSGPYVVSEKLNELLLTGCNIQVTLVGGSDNVIIGCSSFCSINDIWRLPFVATIPGDKCSGVGCGRTNITIGRPTYGVLKRLDETLELYGKVPDAVRIAERGWFDGVADELLSTKTNTSLWPVLVVLEWAVASGPVMLLQQLPVGTADANWSCPRTRRGARAGAATATAATSPATTAPATCASASAGTMETRTSPADAKTSTSASGQRSTRATACA